jgi:hypothetical protein
VEDAPRAPHLLRLKPALLVELVAAQHLLAALGVVHAPSARVGRVLVWRLTHD